jgi:hypothetical protein
LFVESTAGSNRLALVLSPFHSIIGELQNFFLLATFCGIGFGMLI